MKKHKRKPACPQKSLPTKTVLLRAACCLSWLFPFAVFLAYHILAVEEETALVVPGYLGCFFLGFSLFYCVGTSKLAQLFKHGFSWKIFLPPFIIGALLTAASLALTLVPQIYARFSQKVVSDYFFLWLVLLVLGISYALFRPNVKVLLRRAEMRKADINQLTKGGKNFWWYDAVQKACSLGWLYYANKGFTIGFAGTVALQLLLGWWRPAQRMLGALAAAELICCSAMLFWAGWHTDFSLFERQRKRFEPSGLICFLIYCGFLLWVAVRVIIMVVL